MCVLVRVLVRVEHTHGVAAAECGVDTQQQHVLCSESHGSPQRQWRLVTGEGTPTSKEHRVQHTRGTGPTGCGCSCGWPAAGCCCLTGHPPPWLLACRPGPASRLTPAPEPTGAPEEPQPAAPQDCQARSLPELFQHQRGARDRVHSTLSHGASATSLRLPPGHSPANAWARVPPPNPTGP